MTKCAKCNAKIVRQLWFGDDGLIYCSPRCERYEWNPKKHKWETNHRYSDRIVKNIGVAGFTR